MGSKASAAWADERIPLANAVTFADDRMILLSVQVHPDGVASVRAIAETTVPSFLSFNPEWWTEVMSTCELSLPSGDKFVAGEGGQGGDGFIAHCDMQGGLKFSVFLDCSNPFVRLALSADGSRLEAANNRGIIWEFDVVAPWNIRVRTAE